ncbi:hypothetical protein GJV85_07135 [Sulfurimonas aquatica]|uniref:Uncharacterized protein n=1 Tax=Sulfurimonas aquatica TaxID=2672570 RepID=A0A975GCU8_9BACT|nr:hypothetical protein [Sulfurimonas aquatica]QSZ41887.1 hypothetical protein GJV85_07135 [Sulfurimonas aquatica]
MNLIKPKPNQRYVNIMIVTYGVAFFSLMYIFSYAFIFNDVSNGSSRAMKKKFCQENPDKCRVKPKRNELNIRPLNQ